MKCEHGAEVGVSQLPEGGWMGGVERCGCCKSDFGCLTAAWGGPNGCGGTRWTPADRCAACGGTLESWGVPLRPLSAEGDRNG